MRAGASWVWIVVGVLLSGCGGESSRRVSPGAAGAHGVSGGSGGTPAHLADSGGAGPVPDGSGSSGGIGGIDGMLDACSFTNAPSAPAAAADSSPVDVQAQAQLMNRLDQLVGQFLRGDAAVYRGRMSAHDNAGDVFNGENDGVIPNGPALVSLLEAPLDTWDLYLLNASVMGSGAFLSLHGVGTGSNVFLVQSAAEPDMTNMSFIGPDGEEPNSLRNSCDACAPSLWQQPPTIAFGEIDASGTYNDKTSHVFVSADLTLAAPCSLGFDDLVTMSGSALPHDSGFDLRGFSRSGHEMVQHVTGYVDTPDANSSGGGEGACLIENEYAADLYINLDDLSDYGVRNLTLEAPEEVCPV